MISASCPSCGAPVEFSHAAAAVVVCQNCRNTVVNTGTDELVVAGRVSAFSRDLSPIQLGTSGQLGNRGFRVVGVLRMSRPGVRWNEWYLRFDDGRDGWLGEGHGFFQMFSDAAIEASEVSIGGLKPGGRCRIGTDGWHVMEVAEAKVAAADGELPFSVIQDLPRPYADLRSLDGKHVGTLSDGENGGTVLWKGRVVGLHTLDIQGLRNFGGWSDPVMRAYDGPEITATRKLECPACRAPLELRAPGQTVRMACEYCGSEIDLSEADGSTTGKILEARKKRTWKPTIDLGKKGDLDGIPWQIIGAMRRAVRYEGLDYPWTEYFLFNPYRGVRFLAEDDNGHWTLIDRLPDQPEDSAGLHVSYRGKRYKHFQDGKAHVRAVLGEFNWQVRTGDSAKTSDYIKPPELISEERVKHEQAWSHGRYLPHSEVEKAFGIQLSQPLGVAPAQPNPHLGASNWARALRNLLVISGGAIALIVFGVQMSAKQNMLDASWEATSPTDQVFFTEEFELETKGRRNLEVKLDTSLSRMAAEVHVALLNTTTGKVYLPIDSRRSNRGEGSISRADPGSYMARVEVAYNPANTSTKTVTAPVKLSVVRDTPWVTPSCFIFLFGLLAPVVVIWSYLRFENRRWAESDHAGGH